MPDEPAATVSRGELATRMAEAGDSRRSKLAGSATARLLAPAQPASAESLGGALAVRLRQTIARRRRRAGATIILLVRHAAVENPSGLFYGRMPRMGLSQLGRHQAERLRDVIGRCTAIAAFYSGPLLRARQTATILAQRYSTARVSESVALHEVRSSWSGMPFSAVPSGVNLYAPPRSARDETIAQLAHRMQSFLRKLSVRHRGYVVCCVSHGDPIAAARSAWCGEPLALPSLRGPKRPEHCSVTLLGFASTRRTPTIDYFAPPDGVWS